jgi:hypothetical protein
MRELHIARRGALFQLHMALMKELLLRNRMAMRPRLWISGSKRAMKRKKRRKKRVRKKVVTRKRVKKKRMKKRAKKIVRRAEESRIGWLKHRNYNVYRIVSLVHRNSALLGSTFFRKGLDRI